MDKLTINVVATTVLLLFISFPIRGKLEANVSYIPAGGQLIEYDINDVGVPHRTLAEAKTCSTCQCCSAKDGKSCKMMQCCYTWFCNLPGQPIGKCFFRPFACNCNSCS